MGTINQVRQGGFRDHAHLNWMGGLSYDIKNPLHRLKMAAASCFFGEPQYYHGGTSTPTPDRGYSYSLYHTLTPEYLRQTLNAIDPQEWRGKSPSELMVSAIREALDFDPEATLQLAAELRNQDLIRTTPQVIMVEAANHPRVRGTGLVRQYAPQIIRRPDELTVQLAYHQSIKGKKGPIPNSLKRAWRDSFTRFSDYQLAKYRMESREVKLVDVMNLVHPPRTQAVNALANGKLVTTGQTWESIRSAGGTWDEALDVMGHMALLRNLRNLLQAGVPADKFCKKLVDGAPTGKQLPFRYYSAYKAVVAERNPKVLDAIEESLEASLVNLPRFPGRVASLCDNSGSAWGACTSSMGTMHVAEIANLSGVLTGKVSDEGYVGIFGDRLQMVPIRKKSSTFDQLGNLTSIGRGIGQGTENGIWLFWDQAIKNREHWDFVFVYSDMQAGHGGLYGTDPQAYKKFACKNSRNIDVPKLIAEYRRKVNPDVQVFLVQVAGYQDTIVPEFYDKTYILGGWSDGILRFAGKMAGLDNPVPSQDTTSQAPA